MNIRIIPAPFLRCDNLFPYDPNEQCFKTAEGVPIRTMYVGNMSNYTTKKELFQVCSQFGPVEKAMIYKKRTVKGPMYGFVRFRNPQDAAKTVKVSNRVFIRRQALQFFPADSWHQTQPTDNEVDEEEPEGEDQQDSAASPISVLNDDCLRLIFDLFSIEERLTLGAVCKRWRYLNDLYWKSLTDLDFYNPPFSALRFHDQTIEQILSHCPNLLRLRIKQGLISCAKTSILVSIGKYCKKLQELSLHCIKLHRRCIAFIADSCPDLRLIHFHSIANLSDHELSFFLSKCERLESLKVEIIRIPINIHNWMTFLKPPMRELHISTASFVNSNFYTGLRKIKSTLRSLSIEFCKTFSHLQLKFIADNLPDLEALSLRGSLTFQCSGHKLEILKLKKLKSLDLSYADYIEREFMIELAQKCVHLETLNLKGIDQMECCGKSLEEFKSLKNLNLTRSNYLTDATLIALSKKLTQLESIVLTASHSITDEALISIIQNCPKMKNIEVAMCTKVTSKTIMAALDVLLSEKQRRTIAMSVRDTGILQEEWDHDPCFNQFIRLDFSYPPEMAMIFENDMIHFDIFSDEDDDGILFDSDSDMD